MTGSRARIPMTVDALTGSTAEPTAVPGAQASATAEAAAPGPAASGTAVPRTAVPPGGLRWSWRACWATLGVLVPLALFGWYAVHTPPSFDGAMNLQVAQNLSHGLGEVRRYDGITLFPKEIQTSGPYLYLAALLIKLFGSSTAVYALPNLIFLAMLAVTVSLSLRRWPVLQVIGPSFVLFAVPGMTSFAAMGYGELVVGALVFTAFALVGAAASDGRRPVLRCAIAVLLVGVALTVKVVALMALPVLVAGVVALLLARPEVSRRRVAASGLLLVVVPALVELHRLVELGSLTAYRQYWSIQISAIGEQAGVADTGTGNPIPGDQTGGLVKVATHVHLLAVATGLNSVLLVLFLTLPFLLLAVVFLARPIGWRRWLAEPGAVLAGQLALYAGGYLIWWLAITPTAKAWLRRIIVGLAAIVFLYLVVAGMIRDRLARPGLTATPSRVGAHAAPVVAGRRAAGWIGVAAALVVAGLALTPTLLTAGRQLGGVITASAGNSQGIQTLAAAARGLANGGGQLYGVGWWSAPVVALYADLPLGDLQGTQRCDPASGIPTGHAYLIWDASAMRISSRVPTSTIYDFVPIPSTAGPYGTIYRIQLKPSVVCPS